MDQTTLRPKPMPGQYPGQNPGPAPGKHPGKHPGKGHRPHAARRRGRRLVPLLAGLLFAVALVLCGVGLGTVSATVIGMSKLADMQKAAQGPRGAPAAGPGAPTSGPGAPGAPALGPVPLPAPTPAPALAPKPEARPPAALPGTATLGIEAVDAPRGAGALLVGVHIPGPGYTAGLVRGDTLLVFGKARIDSAAELASVVGAARPGRPVTLTVRHGQGGRQVLSVRPGVVT
ncbi:PDZ domain-containing protein [Streptomyces sp. NPDC058308]|uniref:PDZ domain-containing protein n=1 Tax=Streptomyces sp. NPDC058308 TaxID=3346440 RepID=UPI0036DFDE58